MPSPSGFRKTRYAWVGGQVVKMTFRGTSHKQHNTDIPLSDNLNFTRRFILFLDLPTKLIVVPRAGMRRVLMSASDTPRQVAKEIRFVLWACQFHAHSIAGEDGMSVPAPLCPTIVLGPLEGAGLRTMQAFQ